MSTQLSLFSTNRPYVTVNPDMTTSQILQMIDELYGVLSIREPSPVAHSPADIAHLCMSMAHLDHEELRVITFDTRLNVKENYVLYVGAVNSSQVRIAEVFHEAIRNKRTAIALVHNHPSGDPTPSPDDVSITRAIRQAGKLLDIDILDHIIIGKGRYTSLKERGLGFD